MAEIEWTEEAKYWLQQIYDYIARNTIESRIESLLNRKTRLFNDVVENESFRAKLYRTLMEGDVV